MPTLDLFKGINTTDNTISDSLFTGKNIREVSMHYDAGDPNSVMFNKPSAWGTITFVQNDLEGKKKFDGTSIGEILNQMQNFIKTLS